MSTRRHYTIYSADIAERIRLNVPRIPLSHMARLMGMDPATVRKYALQLGVMEKQQMSRKKPPVQDVAAIDRMIELAFVPMVRR